ncbi:MAG: hypothetical protein KJ571_10390 [Bacteroidetes bacterium]|nr:hypothetical protein [Bacteroidota bacterium]
MEIGKQYILQCINCAANNLRLSSEKIEVVAILKEHVSHSADMTKLIADMKKLTKFSKFAIKLGEINQFIQNGKIDFLKISDKFKEHSHLILRELSNLLDIVTPLECRENLNSPKSKNSDTEEEKIVSPENEIDHSKLFAAVKDENKDAVNKIKKSESDLLKEEMILGDLKDENDLTFENFEKEVLKPIKELDAFLNKLSKGEHSYDDLIFYTELMNNNAELSEKIGFEVITNMHIIFAGTLSQIKENIVQPDSELTEKLRACLIVIAAVVRGKDVDITSYLNEAENLGTKLKIIG